MNPEKPQQPISIQRAGKIVTIANEAERATLVNELVAEELKHPGVNAESAFARVEKKHPQLFAAMKHPEVRMPHRTPLPTISNAAPVPFFPPALLTVFRLPADASPEEIAAVWQANGNSAASVNLPKCFDALVNFLERQKGLSLEAARRAARIRFPELAVSVDAILATK